MSHNIAHHIVRDGRQLFIDLAKVEKHRNSFDDLCHVWPVVDLHTGERCGTLVGSLDTYGQPSYCFQAYDSDDIRIAHAHTPDQAVKNGLRLGLV